MSDYVDQEEVEGGDALRLERLVAAVRRRARLILVFVLISTLSTAGAVLLLPNRYEAIATIQIDPREKSISKIEGVMSDLRPDAATIESEVEILKSRTIALKVIELLDLRNDPEFNSPGLIGTALEFIGFAADASDPVVRKKSPANVTSLGKVVGPEKVGESSPETDELAEAFANRLKVGRLRSSLLIAIRFSASDPVKAAKIANTVAEVYLAEQLAAKKRVAGFASDVLERKIEQVRQKVSAAEKRVEDFRAQHGLYSVHGQDLSERKLTSMMEQALIARTETANARAKYERAKALIENKADYSAISDILESHTIRLMREKLASATRKRAELGTRYGDRHPEMVKVQAEVRDARKQLNAEIGRLIKKLDNELQQAKAREAELQQNLANQQNREILNKAQSVELKALRREAETSRKIFETLLERYKQTSETQDLQLPDARLVEQASAPSLPVGPKRKQMVLVGLFASLVIGIGIAIALDLLTPGIARAEDVEPALEVPHISSIPALEYEGMGTPSFLTRLTLADPDSEYVEAIRQARRELDVTAPLSSGRLIMLCGALPGEGVSISAANLAHHYALTGHRVLLLDADMRMSGLSNSLAPSRALGLSSVLQGHCPAEGAILRDEDTGLCFLPAAPSGVQPSMAPELLASPAFQHAIDRMRQWFDVIVVDTPPLLPVIDGRIVADHADQIAFVITWRKTPAPLARKAINTLHVNKDRVVGVIMNQVDAVELETSGMTASRHDMATLAQPAREFELP